MPKPKVLISDSLSPAAVRIFEERGIAVDLQVGLKPDELKAQKTGWPSAPRPR